MEKLETELRDAVPDTRKGRRVLGIEMGAIMLAVVLMALLGAVIFFIEVL